MIQQADNATKDDEWRARSNLFESSQSWNYTAIVCRWMKHVFESSDTSRMCKNVSVRKATSTNTLFTIYVCKLIRSQTLYRLKMRISAELAFISNFLRLGYTSKYCIKHLHWHNETNEIAIVMQTSAPLRIIADALKCKWSRSVRVFVCVQMLRVWFDEIV